MKKSRIIFFIVLIFTFLGILLFWNEFALKLPSVEKEISQFLTPEIQKEVSLPEPIKAKKEYPQTVLTQEGIIKATNIQREKYGLPPLKESLKLDASSAIKVEDMFKNQYFDHYSPGGEGVGDLAKIVNYEFILIGENLAMGNFKDDENLVNAWMESPGHRENILNPKYQEIGVAVKKGIFEGKETWIAVQHFGLPLSACPQPDEKLKVKIDENEKEIDQLLEKIKILEIEIKKMRPKWGSEYERKIDEYNSLVLKYNSLIKETQSMINQYNLQVKSFNQCIQEK